MQTLPGAEATGTPHRAEGTPECQFSKLLEVGVS